MTTRPALTDDMRTQLSSFAWKLADGYKEAATVGEPAPITRAYCEEVLATAAGNTTVRALLHGRGCNPDNVSARRWAAALNYILAEAQAFGAEVDA